MYIKILNINNFSIYCICIIPASNVGSSSKDLTAFSTASIALPPFLRTASPAHAAFLTPATDASANISGMAHAPPCTTITVFILGLPLALRKQMCVCCQEGGYYWELAHFNILPLDCTELCNLFRWTLTEWVNATFTAHLNEKDVWGCLQEAGFQAPAMFTQALLKWGLERWKELFHLVYLKQLSYVLKTRSMPWLNEDHYKIYTTVNRVLTNMPLFL